MIKNDNQILKYLNLKVKVNFLISNTINILSYNNNDNKDIKGKKGFISKYNNQNSKMVKNNNQKGEKNDEKEEKKEVEIKIKNKLLILKMTYITMKYIFFHKEI